MYNKAPKATFCAYRLLDEIKITGMSAAISFHIYKPNPPTLAKYNGGLERALK